MVAVLKISLGDPHVGKHHSICFKREDLDRIVPLLIERLSTPSLVNILRQAIAVSDDTTILDAIVLARAPRQQDK